MHTATYSPEDNKLRIYPESRLSPEDYAAVKAAGFSWAPKQELFVAPAWTPAREDFARQLCGDIGDEDISIMERAEAKAERLEDLSTRRTQDAARAEEAVHELADNIPFGQPILVGHHSERRARKDAEKIENGMRKAVDCWKQAGYWQERAAGSLRLAKYKALPDVRARRIKGIEADKRKEERTLAAAQKYLKTYQNPKVRAMKLQNGKDFLPELLQSWEAGLSYENQKLVGDGQLSVDDALAMAIRNKQAVIAHAQRWIDHLNNRLAYERAMLAESGGLAADRFDLAIGGRVLVGGVWSTILKLNKKDGRIVSVTTNARYCRVRPIEEITDYEAPTAEQAAAVKSATKLAPLCNYPGEGFATCTQAEWDEIPKDYRGTRTISATASAGAHRVRVALGCHVHMVAPDAYLDATARANRRHSYPYVFITDAKRKDPPAGAPSPAPAPVIPPSHPAAPSAPRRAPERPHAAQIAAAQSILKAGIHVMAVPQLFPTPPDLARRMAQEADVIGRRVLEPSAGTGNLVSAIANAATGFDCVRVCAVEVNRALVAELEARRLKTLYANDSNYQIVAGDFLEQGDELGKFDRVVMNPPFANGADIQHIQHALKFLKPDGRLVALCAAGPRQRQILKPLAESSG